MDENRRIQLEKKREKLKFLAKDRSRLELISDFIEILDSKSIDYDVVYSNRAWDWVCERFPVNNWGGLNWEQVEKKQKYSWSSSEQLPKLLKKLIDDTDLDNCLVTVIWSNEERPAIVMFLNDIAGIAQAMFDQDFDTWIVCEENKWCIECHHDGFIGIVLT